MTDWKTPFALLVAFGGVYDTNAHQPHNLLPSTCASASSSFFFVLDRINRIDRIKSVGERILEHVHFSSLSLGFEILP